MKFFRASSALRLSLLIAVVFATPGYAVTCAQGPRFSGWVGSQFCPTCSAYTASGRSAKLLNRSTCVQCSLMCPMTARTPAVDGAGLAGRVDAKALGPVAATADAGCTHGMGPPAPVTAVRPVALLVDWSEKRALQHRRPDVAAVLALLEWRGQRSGLIRDEEVVVSFSGAPTPATVSSIRANGPVSAFDETFAPLPEQHWLRVSIVLRAHPGGTGLDAVVVTLRQQGERVIEAWGPIVLRGSAVLATMNDADGGSEEFLAVEFGREPETI